MNKYLLRSYMMKYHDTQADLAHAMCISLSCLNAKINETSGAQFRQSEISFIKNRYSLTAQEVNEIFFA